MREGWKGDKIVTGEERVEKCGKGGKVRKGWKGEERMER
jgi:hypothetical protein